MRRKIQVYERLKRNSLLKRTDLSFLISFDLFSLQLCSSILHLPMKDEQRRLRNSGGISVLFVALRDSVAVFTAILNYLEMLWSVIVFLKSAECYPSSFNPPFPLCAT